MKHKSIIAIVMAVLAITAAPAAIGASSDQLVVGSQHTTDSDFNAAASLINFDVSNDALQYDGTVVKLVDDVEDGDISEYDIVDGNDGPDGEAPNADDKRAYEGTYSINLTAEGGSTNNAQIESTSGLPSYPRPGENVTVWFNTDSPNEGGSYISVGQDIDNRLRLGFHGSQNNLTVHEFYNGSVEKSDKTSASVKANTWYKFKLTWEEDGGAVGRIINTSGDTIAKTSISSSNITAGKDFIHFNRWSGSGTVHTWFDYGQREVSGGTGYYDSANHTVDNAEEAAINITKFNNVSSTVRVKYWDGSEWVVANETTPTSTGNLTVLVPDISSSKWRVNATVSKNGSDPAFEISDESILFTNHLPEADGASASPQGGVETNNEAVDLSVPISDADFSTAQGDEVKVDFYVDSQLIDSQNITSNQTVDTTATGLEDGDHTWHVELTDSYGGTYTSSTWNFTVNHYAPDFDESNASPQGDEKKDTRTVELSIPMNDTDFAETSGDSVTVDFYFDGEVVDTQTVSQNTTLSTTVTVSEGGGHEWHVEGTDEYGLTTTSSTFSFQAPSELRIYNETAPDTLVNDVTVEIQFYGGQDGDSFTVQRETSDGTINMSGLPVDQEFIVVANADGYNNRRIYVESLYEQANVFLLPENETSVYNVFRVDDKSGSYPPEESRLIIQRGLNRSGNFTWHTISGDFFGSTNEHKTYLRYNVRYRLIIVNDAGESRMMGPYFATDESNPKLISVSSIIVEPPEGQSYYATSWIEDEDEEDDQKTLRFTYTDPDELTDELEVVIHERGNVSNELVNVTTTNVGGQWTYTYTLEGNETEMSWVVDWKGQRDGEEIGQKYPVGEEGNLPLPISSEWLTRFSLVALPVVAALSSERIATLGAMGTVAFAGILMVTGIWQIPIVLWFAAMIIAVGGHALTMARRGSVYG